MNKKISVSLYRFDDQYDVEVYTWIEILNARGILIEDLTNYAYETREEAEEYVESLKEDYEIAEIKTSSEDEEEYEGEIEEMMDEDEFWDLIDLSIDQKDTESQREWLIDLLSQMTDKKIESFQNRMYEVRSDVWNHENMEYAYRLAGVRGGDDSVTYFCSWLISRGRDVVEDVLNSPMEVTHYLNSKNLTNEGARNELFGYVASYALRKKQEKNSLGEL